MLRNVTCPCGVPATVSDVSTNAPASAAGVAMTTSNVGLTAIAVAAAPTIDAVRIQNIETRLRAKELVLYFDYGQPTTALSDAQRKELEDVQYYIAQNPEINIKVTGHADSRGAADYNAQLSVSRAHFVTDYLTGLGANVQKLPTEAKAD